MEASCAIKGISELEGDASRAPTDSGKKRGRPRRWRIERSAEWRFLLPLGNVARSIG